MNAKRILSLFLAAVLTLGVAVTPAVAASAAPALPGSAALEESNGPVSIKLTASGPLVYGSPFELVVETRPAETQYLGVVLGTKGEAKGFVTLVFSDKIRTLLKMIPLPKRMSATPDRPPISTCIPTSSSSSTATTWRCCFGWLMRSPR